MSCSLKSVAALILSALPLCSPMSQAQVRPSYLVSVPFEFHINQVVMPAGSYEILPLTAHVMRLRALGSSRTADLLVFPIDEPGTMPSGQLRFARYGRLYFLREFSPSTEWSGRHLGSRCLRSSEENRAARTIGAIASVPTQQPTQIAINASLQR